MRASPSSVPGSTDGPRSLPDVPPPAVGRGVVLARLRRDLERLERRRAPGTGVLAFGVPDIDACLPDRGLRLGALHEISEAGAGAEFSALSALFAGGIAARLPGEIVWCLLRRNLFAPSLAGVGLPPHRVLFVETGRDRDVLPAMEEAVRHRGVAAVVGEVATLSLTASRRLHLAAEASGALVLVVRRWSTGSERLASESEPTASLTRWRVSPLAAPLQASRPPPPGLHRARWLVDLVRARGAPARSWILEAPDATGRLDLPADMVHRSVPSPPTRLRSA